MGTFGGVESESIVYPVWEWAETVILIGVTQEYHTFPSAVFEERKVQRANETGTRSTRNINLCVLLGKQMLLGLTEILMFSVMHHKTRV